MVDAVVLVNPGTARILYMNCVVAEQLGFKDRLPRELTLHDIFNTQGESLLQINARFLAAQPLILKMRGAQATELEVEVRFSTVERRGREVWVYTARDVSLQRSNEQELRDNQSRLARIANHDQLTGLPNRHYMSSFLPDAIASAKAAGGMIGVVFLDLDRFKLINDTQGHEIGDKLLRVVAERLRECVRQVDVVIRMGGDEFVIVLVNVKSYEEVTRSANRIAKSFNEPVDVEGRHYRPRRASGSAFIPETALISPPF